MTNGKTDTQSFEGKLQDAWDQLRLERDALAKECAELRELLAMEVGLIAPRENGLKRAREALAIPPTEAVQRYQREQEKVRALVKAGDRLAQREWNASADSEEYMDWQGALDAFQGEDR